MSFPIAISTTTNHNHGATLRNVQYPSCPVSPTSPLSLPPLMPDNHDDECSPSPSIGFLTPNHSPPLHPRIIDGNSHTALSSLSSMPSPENGGAREDDFKPLLPAHHPLRKHLIMPMPKEYESPPHSPKGHPIRPTLSKNKSHVISNPYFRNTHGTTTTYLMRVPRRLRPLLLFIFCFLVFGIVCLSRALSHASELDVLMAQRRALAMERRVVHVDGLIDINAPGQKVEMVQPASKMLIGHAAVPFTFADEQDELLAVINFITSTTANALPPLDPSVPLDPATILDFDPSRSNAKDDFELLRTEMNTLYPIVLFGKMRDPWHREVKKVLAEYKITPAPLVVDVDQRRDHLLFIPLLARLLKTDELPQMLLLGQSLGSYHDILSLKKSGKLRETLENSGHVAIRDVKKKKKGVKERERLENERILGPAPIVEE